MQNPASLLFTPASIGPLTLRNRTIRAAAFEGMCPANSPAPQLLEYHRAVARGGIGMTTVAYAAVCPSGLSFPHQLLLRAEVIPALKELADAVHQEGAAISIQIGHCGNMAKRRIAGGLPLSVSKRFNLYVPTLTRPMTEIDIDEVIAAFGQAVSIVKQSGFDAVEVHAGHGYLISQFLSPYTNRRKDQWGGSFENRTRFLRAVLTAVKKAAGNDLAVLVKMNLRDAVKGGIELPEAIEVAKILEQVGADALILSGGFVSKSPMYVMRGAMPLKSMTHYMTNPLMRIGLRLFGRWLIRPVPFAEAYFLEDALKVRSQVKIPIVYVGGLISGPMMDSVLNKGFEFVSMARALVHDPDFVNKVRQDARHHSDCRHSNYCIARMYSSEMRCFHQETGLPRSLTSEINKAEQKE